MRRAPDERGPRDGLHRVAAACLAALREDDPAALLTAVGAAARVVVDGGDGAGACAAGPRGLLLLAESVRRSRADRWEVRPVNGVPGLVGRRGGRAVAVIVMDGVPGAVTEVWVMCDPGKLRHWDA